MGYITIKILKEIKDKDGRTWPKDYVIHGIDQDYCKEWLKNGTAVISDEKEIYHDFKQEEE